MKGEDMTIDEAIEFERYLSKQPEICNEDFMKCEEHKQIAEWLEELKEARKGFEENRKAGYSHGYEDGYAKALDEFAEALCEKASELSERCTFPGGLIMDVVTLDGISEIALEIAEQLKGVQE